jgi:hypothetical protein
MVLKIHELLNERARKHKKNHEIYKELLEQIYTKIKNKNQLGHVNMTYLISPIIPGKPLINIEHAMMYICRKLNAGNFKTRVSNNIIYIEWS